MTRWAYHVTTEEALRGIARHGLRPGNDPSGDPRLHGVWFTSAASVDSDYGDVVLRFPYPEEMEHREGDRIVGRAIPAQEIEVQTHDGWMDLEAALGEGGRVFNIADTRTEQFPGLERRRGFRLTARSTRARYRR